MKYYLPWFVSWGLLGILEYGLHYFKHREFKTDTVVEVLAVLVMASLIKTPRFYRQHGNNLECFFAHHAIGVDGSCSD